MSLKNRIEDIAIGLVDAAVLPLAAERTVISRQLLELSSILSIARANGSLSSMNVEIITREANILLKEIAAYEEPRILLDNIPTLSGIARDVLKQDVPKNQNNSLKQKRIVQRAGPPDDKGHIKDRREAILSVIKNKQKASIKDISTLIRGVSEKTIQRELSALIEEGAVLKQGERRWSIYTLAS